MDRAKEIANSVREIADRQFREGEGVGFEFNGQLIINPWMDESGRFELTNEEAIERYGRENITMFILDIIDCYDL